MAYADTRQLSVLLGSHDESLTIAWSGRWLGQTKGLCVMPRFARIFFISLVSAAGSCSGEQLAQKRVEKKDIRQQLATAYESCVRTSFASQLPTMVDRNMAIDQAFTVCQTEEKKLQDVSDGAISAYRNTLKEELLRR
jgi:hypothetical protein